MAQRLLELVGENTATGEPLFTDLPGGTDAKEKINYSIEVSPNPGAGRIKVAFDLGDKINGNLIVKDAITGEVMMEETLSSNEQIKRMDVSPLQNGNYVFELHGDDQFLKALHFMKY